ncbi:UNVERIFIED_CONTAM: hypothetical protein GTU68_037355 [Idotea baltica]|uniref:cytidine deaminase n=1 Tax=Francisella sp. Scap27 TaxID=2589986 RepID=UPI0015BC657D|nr:cytidine deaminase [Francisella sp. Scap27]MCL4117806.1 hypothetical protein [Idotea baltica]QLE79737.1 cytidine deaminase [Francisella sp. Scap27]
MTSANKSKLIDKAIEASANAYAPYSNFKVGAALLMKDGSYILGANVENCAYGPSNCAERSALFAAYSQGFRKEDIKMIATITDTPKASSSCGTCRQVMAELLTTECVVLFSNNAKSDIKETTIDELLPDRFILE